MGKDQVTDTRSIGPFSEPDDIPPPPDGSGAVAIPPPPDGSGVVPVQAQQAAPSESQVQFGDDPNRVLSHMQPEDEAHITQLLRARDYDGAAAYAHSKGFTLGNVDAIRAGQEGKGGLVPDGAVYERQKVESEGKFGALTNGLAEGATLGFGDELVGLAAGIKGAAQGGSFGDTYNRSVDYTRAQLGSDENEHGLSSLAGNIAGGLLLPVGLEKAGVTASTRAFGLAARDAAIAEGLAPQAADRIAARAVAHRLAGEGAAYGGAYGAGASEGGAGERLRSGAAGAVGGALAGQLAGSVGGALSRRAEASAAAREAEAAPQREAMAAADRIGLGDAMLPADTGGTTTRFMTATTAQTPLGVAPIVRAANKLNAKGAKVLQSNVESLGESAADVEGFGTAATEGALRYAKSAKNLGGRMYDAAVAKGGNVMVDLKSARDTLDSQIARLEAVPGGGQGLEEAKALRAEIKKPFTVQGIRDWRTENFIDPKFRNTPVEGRMKAVVTAASRDVESALRSSGNNEAADLYAAADNHWREMLVNIKRNIEPLIGKMDNLKSPEAVSKALTSAAKNNGGRLGAFVHSLPEEQQKIVTASFLSPLGIDKTGRFSISAFASDWGKLSPIAKRAAFPAETRAALDDLATVGGQAKEAMSYANSSKTGGVIAALATGGTGLLGVKTLGAALVGQYGMGRLLASPRFARWLARAPKTSLGATAYIDRLGRIAKAEPAIASDLLHLQQRLADDVGSQRSAAQ